ncbi:hypothetical protein [Flaviaesturariibacter aridisoli]|uniref:DUF4251 domain-containing protein n=1 Tax=Flaviaesturariibacter aridisoli TaxID=2545761 RepID=A0A4V2WND0_9BACT|nr:hypothetical protein [Flaviaesturariibacter aridisoli]TCZ75012.1 hypothetical protein E0486_01520 [Flaviaesturariibacter aridisoli]
MKNLALILITVLLTATAGAQGAARPAGDLDPTINRQADSLRKLYMANGYILMKENAVNMESQFEFPVLMQLQAGVQYQFVFIGEMSSRLYEVRMFDWAEKQVYYKKHMWGDIDGNIIAYPYAARQTEYHLLRVLQVNKQKKKDLTGYVMLFRRTHSQLELEEQAQRYGGAAPTASIPVRDSSPIPADPGSKTDSTKKKKNNYDQYLTGGN